MDLFFRKQTELSGNGVRRKQLQREPDVGEGLVPGSVGADLALRQTEPEARGACLPLGSLAKLGIHFPLPHKEVLSLQGVS